MNTAQIKTALARAAGTARTQYSKLFLIAHIVLDALAIAMLLILAFQIGGAL